MHRRLVLGRLLLLLTCTSAFRPPASPRLLQRHDGLALYSSNSLYADQQDAQDRQAVKEGELMRPYSSELIAPADKKNKKEQKAGTGFGKSAAKLDPRQLLGDARAKHLNKEGSQGSTTPPPPPPPPPPTPPPPPSRHQTHHDHK